MRIGVNFADFLYLQDIDEMTGNVEEVCDRTVACGECDNLAVDARMLSF